jgi:hypothetical protein
LAGRSNIAPIEQPEHPVIAWRAISTRRTLGQRPGRSTSRGDHGLTIDHGVIERQ